MAELSEVPLPLDIYVVPGSHFDLGWVLHPDGSLALGDDIIHEAIELMTRQHPEFRFTIEYTLFLRHFLETYPDQRSQIQALLDDGKLEVCAGTTGAMEQIFDGETMIRQITHAITWLKRTFNYQPVCAQHTDLPGHTIQMPQILKGCGIDFIAYSRYRPPCPLHWWESPDGSRVLACNHVQHYEWGRVLRKDLPFAEDALLEYLQGPFRRLWPAQQVLMPEERDLDWIEPKVCKTVAEWNETHPDIARLRFALLREFFAAVDRQHLPSYRGESPYGFYSIPAFEPATYQTGRRAEQAILAAERFAAIRALEGLGSIRQDRLTGAWEDLFWPHDHNFGGQDGAINDDVRLHRAVRAKHEAEAVLREVETTYLLHVKSDPTRGKAFLVFNPLSWARSDVVELKMELPVKQLEAIQVLDYAGQRVPAQLLSVESAEDGRVDYQLDDPDLAEVQTRIALLARDVPATGYSTFYVQPARSEEPSSVNANVNHMESNAWRIDLNSGKIVGLTCKRTGRQLVSDDQGDFFSLVALEDLRGSLEDGYDPWDPRDNPPNYTGRSWPLEIDPDSVEVVEHGPVRTRLRIAGSLLGCPVTREIDMYDDLPRVEFRVSIDWKGQKSRQVRALLPFALQNPDVTYETPFGSVLVGQDEMPGTYRGDGTRWVQKWIDLSEPDFGVTLSAGCCAVNLRDATIAPLLVSTTYCRGDAYYWMRNKGTHTFSFSLQSHDGNWHAHRHYGLGWAQWSPLRVVRGQPRLVSVSHRACLLDRKSYLSCEHPGVVVSAMNQTEDQRELLVRVFNVTSSQVRTSLEFGFHVESVQTSDMLGHPAERMTCHENAVPIELKPHQIQTYRVRLEPARSGHAQSQVEK